MRGKKSGERKSEELAMQLLNIDTRRDKESQLAKRDRTGTSPKPGMATAARRLCVAPRGSACPHMSSARPGQH